MKTILFILAVFFIPMPHFAADDPLPVEIGWLGEKAPLLEQGISWGVPWKPGTLKKNQSFVLSDQGDKELPLQTWPMAYWPDGSIKWLGCATVAGPEHADQVKLMPGKGAKSAEGIKITENKTDLLINTGAMSCRISLQGSNLVKEMIIDGKLVASNGHLECSLEKEFTQDG